MTPEPATIEAAKTEPAPPPSTDDLRASVLRVPTGSTARVVLPWLVRLRWVAVAGQTMTVLLVMFFFQGRLPVWPIVGTIAFAAATNVLLWLRLASQREPERLLLPGMLTLDTLLLTVLLYFSGGPHNPFGVLYVVHVAMAAVVLSTRWTWSIVGLSALCYGALFWDSEPLRLAGGGEPSPRLFLFGSWVSLVLVAGVTATFIERTAQALRRGEAQLAHVRTLAERNERLASLTTLATGAAHELGTPLGTIAVVARELERAAERLRDAGGDDGTRARLNGLIEDARLVRAEVDRCRRILDRMGTQAERSVVNPPSRFSPADLMGDLRAELSSNQASVLRLDARTETLVAPRHDLVQALLPLVTNAFDATADAGPVTLEVSRDGRVLRFAVKDAGTGMPPEVLEHASEPFFTTKPPGRGTGLGLYLVRLFGERLGGKLRLESRAGPPGASGTTATLELPESPLDVGGKSA